MKLAEYGVSKGTFKVYNAMYIIKRNKISYLINLKHLSSIEKYETEDLSNIECEFIPEEHLVQEIFEWFN